MITPLILKAVGAFGLLAHTAVRRDADAADMDMVISCPARSRRKVTPEAVRAESEALLEQFVLVEATVEGATCIVETGEMLSEDKQVAVGPAVAVISSWRGKRGNEGAVMVAERIRRKGEQTELTVLWGSNVSLGE